MNYFLKLQNKLTKIIIIKFISLIQFIKFFIQKKYVITFIRGLLNNFKVINLVYF